MRRAIAEMAMLGLAGGALGCWVVLHRFSFAAESLAHAIFPGVVVASLAGVPLLLGGGPAAAVAGLAIAAVLRIPEVGREVAIGVVVTTLFGLGALLALAPASPPGLGSLLFGDILGPSDSDLLAAGALAALVIAALWVLHARFLAVGFDRTAARSLGISSSLTEALLLVLLAIATVVSVQGLGNLLVVALFVGPAAAARQLTDRVGPMLALSIAIALLAGLAGLYASYYLGTAGGASIALAVLAAYLLTIPAGRALRSRRPAARRAVAAGG